MALSDSSRFSRLTDWLFVIGAFALSLPFVAQSYQFSATFDEPFYLDAGLTSWRTGSNKMLMKAGTMPLPVELQTWPLFGMERDRREPIVVGTELDVILKPARMVNLVFWFALLGYGYRLTKLAGGVWAARFACLLMASEPNLLAHAGLATTDIAVTAGCLAATFYFVAGRGRSGFWRIFIPGVSYGVAMLCKASALAFVPIIWGCIALHELYATGAFHSPSQLGVWGRIRQFVRVTDTFRSDFIYQFLVAMVVVFAYCGSDWKQERTFVEWAYSLNPGPLSKAMITVSEKLTIFTNAGEAFAEQIKHNMRGHGSYVAGQWHERAVWYYFGIALAAKLTLPLLLLVFGSCTIGIRRWFASPLGWICLALLLFTVNCRVQIGIRLVFPLVTFLIITATVTLLRKPEYEPIPKWRLGVMLAVILAQFGFTYLNRSDLLRHFNPLFGGAGNGHRWLSDSNCDWGQGLPELERYTNGQAIAVWYFGVDPRADRPPLAKLQFHQFPDKATVADFEAALAGRPLAVSTSIQFDNPIRSAAGAKALAWIQSQEPLAKAGPYFIYRPRTNP